MKKLLSTLAAFSLVVSASVWAKYPDKPITLIVPWGAGGGTDTVARIVAKGMQEELGVRINVINRAGGSGVTGHSAIANAKPDGYTLGVITSEIALMHHKGMTDLTYKDFTFITRTATVDGGVQVAKDSKFKSISDLLAYAKAHPGELKASGSGLNSIWHINCMGMLESAGISRDAIRFIPSQGASSGLQELVSGSVDMTTSATGEAQSMVSAGLVKNLVIMTDGPSKIYPDIPVFKEVTGHNWQLGTWHTIGAPKGLSQEKQDILLNALNRAFSTGELKTLIRKRGFELSPLSGDKLMNFLEEEDQKFGKILAEK